MATSHHFVDCLCHAVQHVWVAPIRSDVDGIVIYRADSVIYHLAIFIMEKWKFAIWSAMEDLVILSKSGLEASLVRLCKDVASEIKRLPQRRLAVLRASNRASMIVAVGAGIGRCIGVVIPTVKTGTRAGDLIKSTTPRRQSVVHLVIEACHRGTISVRGSRFSS